MSVSMSPYNKHCSVDLNGEKLIYAHQKIVDKIIWKPDFCTRKTFKILTEVVTAI